MDNFNLEELTPKTNKKNHQQQKALNKRGRFNKMEGKMKDYRLA